MNGLSVSRSKFSGDWCIHRERQLCFWKGGTHALIRDAMMTMRITIAERDWLLRGYSEWADLQPGECWPKEAGK